MLNSLILSPYLLLLNGLLPSPVGKMIWLLIVRSRRATLLINNSIPRSRVKKLPENNKFLPRPFYISLIAVCSIVQFLRRRKAWINFLAEYIKEVVPHDLNKSLASVSQISRESVLRRRKNQLYRQQCISSKMTRDLKSARSVSAWMVSASLLAFSISRMRLWFCLDTSHYLLWLNSEISGFQFRYIWHTYIDTRILFSGYCEV